MTTAAARFFLFTAILMVCPRWQVADAMTQSRQTASNESRGVAFAHTVIGTRNLAKGISVRESLYGSYLFLSWKVWTLVGAPVEHSTAILILTKPLVIHDSRGTFASTTKVPMNVMAKISGYNVTAYLKVTQLLKYSATADWQKSSHGSYYMRFDPGAMGRPMIGGLAGLSNMSTAVKGQYWSFNMPGSPSWRKLFGDNRWYRFLPAATAKRIVRVSPGTQTSGTIFGGFELGDNPTSVPFSVPEKWALPPTIPQFYSPKISFDLSPVLEWYTKKVETEKRYRNAQKAVKGLVSNIERQCHISMDTVRERIGKIEQRPQAQATSGLENIYNRILTRTIPAAVAKGCDLHRYEEVKKAVKKAYEAENKQRAKERDALLKESKKQRGRVSRFMAKKRSRLARKGKRTELCPGCPDVNSYRGAVNILKRLAFQNRVAPSYSYRRRKFTLTLTTDSVRSWKERNKKNYKPPPPEYETVHVPAAYYDWSFKETRKCVFRVSSVKRQYSRRSVQDVHFNFKSGVKDIKLNCSLWFNPTVIRGTQNVQRKVGYAYAKRAAFHKENRQCYAALKVIWKVCKGTTHR